MTTGLADSSAPTAGIRHLLYVLALLEAGLTLLATIGQTIAMGGGPLYVIFGLAEATLYVVTGAAAARGRRYGVIALIVCECVRLAGFSLSVLAGLLPWVELPLTGATLTDGLVLPIAVIILAGCSLPLRPTPSRSMLRRPMPPHEWTDRLAPEHATTIPTVTALPVMVSPITVPTASITVPMESVPMEAIR